MKYNKKKKEKCPEKKNKTQEKKSKNVKSSSFQEREIGIKGVGQDIVGFFLIFTKFLKFLRIYITSIRLNNKLEII